MFDYADKRAIEALTRDVPDMRLVITMQAYANIRLVCADIEQDRRRIMRGRQMAEVR